MGRKEQKEMINELIESVNELKSKLPSIEDSANDLCKDIDNLQNQLELNGIENSDNFDADCLKSDIWNQLLSNEAPDLAENIQQLVDEIDEYLSDLGDKSPSREEEMELKLAAKDNLTDDINFEDVTTMEEVSDKLDSLIDDLISLK
jgi:predicted transcriptional regulator